MKRFGDLRDWFFEKRFGLFVHWGIYSVGERHEQELWRFGTPREEYERYAECFNPVNFNPRAWLDAAENAGMQYLVFTAKHHDGFCMWDTHETDFNIMNTPYRRDVLGMLADECHKRNFPLVIYYSAVDWHHPQYPNLGRHHEIVTAPEKHDMDAYMRFLKAQVRELCTNYGTIHGFWWDMNVPKYVDDSVNEMIRNLQPAAVINNRGYGEGDFSTPERNFQENPTLPFAAPTEACDSIGVNSWGYRREEDYYSVYVLERKIASILALGGNFLLNAGPRPDGTFPPEALHLLSAIGTWFQRVSHALTAPPCYGVLENSSVFCTGRGRELNLILAEAPSSSTLPLFPLNVLPEKVELLNTGPVLEWTTSPVIYQRGQPEHLRLRGIPADELYGEIPVIRLTFRDDVIHGRSVEAASDAGSVAQG